MPKETSKNILLRVPSSLGAKIAHRAGDANVSQTALINATLLLSFLAWGEEPLLGHPDAALKLLDELDRAWEENDIAFGAFAKGDWVKIGSLIADLATYDLIGDVKTRQENEHTVAFRFELTKLGRAIMPGFTAIIRGRLRARVPAGS